MARRGDDDDRAGREGEINEIKEIKGAREGTGREDVVSRPARAGRHAVKYGFTADTYREMYILCFTRRSAFRSSKVLPTEYHRR